ncbi:hypothetical protein E2986_07999 [Frieseomelitta varia]|uniref:Uncharacterized protein n=1 Tax=Frieseomelitta varia TaxID=561572 RepID=A0A833VX21_9HYME|nr:hypothetical protein E2986_07999 [Frieseomelitta varia]
MFHDYIIYLVNNFNSQLLLVCLIEIKSDTGIEIMCSKNSFGTDRTCVRVVCGFTAIFTAMASCCTPSRWRPFTKTRKRSST